MHRLITSLLILLSYSSFSQVYDDYLGAGHQIGVTTTSSPQENADTSHYAISGTGLIPDLTGASRFLSQATLGVNYEEIELVSTIGIDAWLEAQFALPYGSYMDRYDETFAEIQTIVDGDNPANQYTSFVFYDFIFNDPDLLRQKVAFALSQIFVISKNGVLSRKPEATMSFHDILYQGAFGNYRDMLGKVTNSMAMAKYLSHFKNRRGDVIGNTLPDENYAREIMQLFSIGLIKMELDGTPIRDSKGDIIPTYDIENVAELAKVFTGIGGQIKNDGVANDFFFENNINLRFGTTMFDDFHSVGTKAIFDDVVIPAGQSGTDDVEQALDEIFNHPNVGPFIAIRLIQQLVKSNPSPAYIRRVATVFNNNGKGTRGDLQAVVKAILLDPEARSCDWINHPETGKLIQPMERFITLFKAFDISSPSGTLWFNDELDLGSKLKQNFQEANSVFNYFSPFYAEDKIIAPKELVSPEFEILDGITAIEYINEMEDALKRNPFDNRTARSNTGTQMVSNSEDKPFLDLSDEINIYEELGMSPLLDRLDILICRGQLSQRVKNIITSTIEENIQSQNNYDVNDILHDVLYYIFISPDYMIQK